MSWYPLLPETLTSPAIIKTGFILLSLTRGWGYRRKRCGVFLCDSATSEGEKAVKSELCVSLPYYIDGCLLCYPSITWCGVIVFHPARSIPRLLCGRRHKILSRV